MTWATLVASARRASLWCNWVCGVDATRSFSGVPCSPTVKSKMETKAPRVRRTIGNWLFAGIAFDGHGWFRTSDLSRVKPGWERVDKGPEIALASGILGSASKRRDGPGLPGITHDYFGFGQQGGLAAQWMGG
jgi:hypothetical protein